MDTNINANNVDWVDIENKISIICRKFDNLDRWRDDLMQELRIHAYYNSSDYWDLYRKAIDFWRKVQTRETPEIPYFDLEILGKSKNGDFDDQFNLIVDLVMKELNRPGYNKCDNDMLELSKLLLSVIIEDIDPESTVAHNFNKSSLNHYFNQRLNLTWISEETGIGYKKLVAAMKNLEDIIRGLAAMKKIELPPEYFKGYYQ